MLRRLRHRVPVSVRMHWKLLAMCCAFCAVLGFGFADAAVQPLVLGDQRQDGDQVTEDIKGTVDVFDETVAHTVVLTYSEDDYQRMLEEYWDEGEKDWIEADLVIDGTAVPSIGLRLKGNSTLMSLRRAGESGEQGWPGGGAGRNGQQRGQQGAGGEQSGQDQQPGQAPASTSAKPATGTSASPKPAATATKSASPKPAATATKSASPKPAATASQSPQQEAGQQPGGGQRMGGMGGMNTNLSADQPEAMPWLISFDEYVEGRRYQGYQSIAVRSAGTSTAVALNEAVALCLVATSGEAAQRFAYSSFVVNDRPAKARLLVEDPGEQLSDSLGSAGVLYKALSTGSFTYQGTDQTEYEDDFKQINRTGSQDIQPVIELLKWAEDASDSEFAKELGDHVEVESFAKYVALQNLLMNFDDMAGPGKNYYLWYSLDTKRFTVVTADLNLTFNGSATAGPYDNMTMGGFRAAGQQAGGDGQMPEGGFPDMPEGGFPGMSEGGQMPEGGFPGMPEGNDDEGDRGQRGGMFGGNALKERFLAAEAFHEVYEKAYRELYQELFASGAATRSLTAISGVLGTLDSADRATVDSEVATLRTSIETRTKSLATNEVITGKA